MSGGHITHEHASQGHVCVAFDSAGKALCFSCAAASLPSLAGSSRSALLLDMCQVSASCDCASVGIRRARVSFFFSPRVPQGFYLQTLRARRVRLDLDAISSLLRYGTGRIASAEAQSSLDELALLELMAAANPDTVLAALHMALESVVEGPVVGAPAESALRPAAGQGAATSDWKIALLTTLGHLLGSPAVLTQAVAIRFPLLRHAQSALVGASDAGRGAAYFILLRAASVQPLSQELAAYLQSPVLWDLVCSDVTRGSCKANSHVRTNALALLCSMVAQQRGLVPWPKIIDALKVAVASGDPHEKATACHLLSIAVRQGQGATMIARGERKKKFRFREHSSLGRRG